MPVPSPGCAAQRTVDDRMAEPQRVVPRRVRPRELGLPEVLGDAVPPGVAGADPDQPALVVDLVALPVAALRTAPLPGRSLQLL